MKTIGTIGVYKILLSNHARQRSRERKIDIYKVVSAVLAFGAERLRAYKKDTADIMLQDIDNNFSVVFAVKRCRLLR